jgi:hypothetical protein
MPKLTVEFTVKDNYGNPLPNIPYSWTFTWGAGSGTTDANGKFTIWASVGFGYDVYINEYSNPNRDHNYLEFWGVYRWNQTANYFETVILNDG